MLEQLGARARQAASPVVDRWNGFAAKVASRVDAILAEATEGIDALLSIDPTDAASIGSAFGGVESRLKDLEMKVEHSVDKLSDDWDEATDDLEVGDADQALLRLTWSWIINESRRISREIEQRRELWVIRKNADWARAVYVVAQAERNRTHSCAECGAPLQVTIRHASSNLACASCGAVNEIALGLASGMYFQGNGVHSLASEAASQHWLSEWQHEHWFNSLRHPTDADRERYLAAARGRWLAYYHRYAQLHPGFSRSVEQAVDAKMAHYTTWDWTSETRERRLVGKIVALAAARDRAGLVATIQAAGHVDLDDLVCAVHERRDRDGAALMLDIQHQLQGEDEPKNAWINEKLGELDADLAKR
jgi:hypothetical protein